MPSNIVFPSNVFPSNEHIAKNTIIFDILSDIALEKIIYVTNDNLSKLALGSGLDQYISKPDIMSTCIHESKSTYPPYLITLLHNFFNKMSNHGIYVVDPLIKINSVYENNFGEKLYITFSLDEITKIDRLISKILCNIIKNNIVDKILDGTFVFNKQWLCPTTWGLYSTRIFSDKVQKILEMSNDKIKTADMLNNFYNKSLMNYHRILDADTKELIIPNIIKKYIKRVISNNTTFINCFDIFNDIFNRLSPNYHIITECINRDLYKIIFVTLWDIKLRGINIQKFASDDSVITGIISVINNNYCNTIDLVQEVSCQHNVQ
jgi:hypothetical protein